jgi:PTS system nitrogen regulatory IIA component
MLGNAAIRRELLGAPSVISLYEGLVRHARGASAGGGEKRVMKLLTVVLYLDEFLNDILEFFIEAGIDGATVIESFGMGEYISNIPLFADFIGFMQKNKNQSRTILALVPEDRVQEMVDGIEEITGDLDKKQGAMVMALDVPFYKGTMRML